jgi:hypothetical protein
MSVSIRLHEEQAWVILGVCTFNLPQIYTLSQNHGTGHVYNRTCRWTCYMRQVWLGAHTVKDILKVYATSGTLAEPQVPLSGSHTRHTLDAKRALTTNKNREITPISKFNGFHLKPHAPLSIPLPLPSVAFRVGRSIRIAITHG